MDNQKWRDRLEQFEQLPGGPLLIEVGFIVLAVIWFYWIVVGRLRGH